MTRTAACLAAALAAVSPLGCNPTPGPGTSPARATTPTGREKGVHVDAPGVKVDVEKRDGKAKVDVRTP